MRNTVPFELTSGLIVVEVFVNGTSQRFVIDTGASHSVLTARAATTLGLASNESSRSSAVGARGTATASPVVVRTFVWGDFEFVDVTLMRVAMEHVCGMVGSYVAGIIGYDILSRFRFTVDYNQRQVILEQAG